MFFRKEQEKARKHRNLFAEAGRTVLRANAGSEKIVVIGGEASAPSRMIRSIPKRSTEQEQAGIAARAVAEARAAEEPTVRTRASSAENLAKSAEISASVEEKRSPL